MYSLCGCGALQECCTCMRLPPRHCRPVSRSLFKPPEAFASHDSKPKRATQANLLLQIQLQFEQDRGRVKREEQIYECGICYHNQFSVSSEIRTINSQPAKIEKSMSTFSFQHTGLIVGFQSPAAGLHCTHRNIAHSDCVRIQLVLRP